MTRAEHLEWAKRRALEYIDAGEVSNGIASMMSDLRKHPELERHVGILIGAAGMMSGYLSNSHEARQWVEGFN